MDNRRHRHRSQSLWIATLAAAALAAGAGEAVAGNEMTLRINDAMAVPGDRVAVVLRTYASRGVGQGQICLITRDTRGAGEGPLVALEEVVVFSEQGDAEVAMTFDDEAQMAMAGFTSPSATINWADGPIAVFFFRLDGAVQPGETFTLELDAAETFLIDAEEENIPLDLRGGELLVRAPGSPRVLAAEGDDVNSGSVARLGVETSEQFPIGGGQVALRWDPAAAGGTPTVTMDARYGTSFFSTDLTEPGRALVRFDSPDGSLNEVPGLIVAVDLPTSHGLPPEESLVTLDPGETFLEDPFGTPLPLTLLADLLEIRIVGLIFADDFESGGLGEWSVAMP